MSGYLYLLQLREFVRSGEPVFKVGRSNDWHRRMMQYPKGSKLFVCSLVSDMVRAEKELLAFLRTHRSCEAFVTLRKDLGNEYVETDDPRRLRKAFLAFLQKPVCAYDHPLPTLNILGSKDKDKDKDITLSVIAFVKKHEKKLHRSRVPSTTLYKAFMKEQKDASSKHHASLTEFTRTLQLHFGVRVSKAKRLPAKSGRGGGIGQELIFGYLMPRSQRLPKQII